MATFLLSAARLGPGLGTWSPFCSLSACRVWSIFPLFYLFICLAFFFSSVPGSVPEREHDRLFALCRRDLAPDREHGRLLALCRRVGFGALLFLFLFLFRDPNLLFLFLSSVPGSVPERGHGRLFALCRRGFIPD